jgi:hypothetical protein
VIKVTLAGIELAWPMKALQVICGIEAEKINVLKVRQCGLGTSTDIERRRGKAQVEKAGMCFCGVLWEMALREAGINFSAAPTKQAPLGYGPSGASDSSYCF